MALSFSEAVSFFLRRLLEMLPMLSAWTPDALWDLLRSNVLRIVRFVMAGLVAALKSGYQHPALVGAAALLLRLWSSSKQLDPLEGAAACAGHSPGPPHETRTDRPSHANAVKAVSLRVGHDDEPESSVESYNIHSDEEDEESNATSRVSWATSRASQKLARRTRPTHQYAETYTKSWAVEEENRSVLSDFKMRAAQMYPYIPEDDDFGSLAPSASCSRRTSPERPSIPRAKPRVIYIHTGPNSDPPDLDAINLAIQKASRTRERTPKVESAPPAPARRGRHGRRRHGRVA
jgi:hypothetical protein